MEVYVYIRITHMCVYVNIHTRRCAHMNMRITDLSIQTCVYMCIYICIYARVHSNMYIYIHVDRDISICRYIDIPICVCICVYVYMYICTSHQSPDLNVLPPRVNVFETSSTCREYVMSRVEMSHGYVMSPV